MIQQVELSIVRIWSSVSNKVVGAGFQIYQDCVLTCAHVITEALFVKEISKELQQIEISLDYPFVNPKNYCKARIISWNHEHDIAVLRLVNRLQGTHPASM